MIIDTLNNASRYYSLKEGIEQAFEYLKVADLNSIEPGKYEIDGENLFAIVQEYETLSPAGEQMESHKKYIDVQYMIYGEEMVGHMLRTNQEPSVAYDAEKDFMLFAEEPTFYTKLQQGTFMVFFPSDLHMPSLQVDKPAIVKKVVVKVKADQ